MSSDRKDPRLHAQPGHGRPASRGRALSQPPAKPSLLTLPRELRGLILKQLLRSDEPFELAEDQAPQVHTDANACYAEQGRCPATKFTRLYPNVLRTCKELCYEGTAILYDNTLSARVSCAATEECCPPNNCVVPSPLFASRQPSREAVIERISKIRVQIFVKQCDLSHYSLRVLSDGARMVYHWLESVPHWREVTIDIEEIGDTEDLDLTMLVVPLSNLRRCEAVKINAPYKDKIFDQVANAMMSDEPVVNLHRMYKSLDQYWNDYVDAYPNDANVHSDRYIEPEEAVIIDRIETHLMNLQKASDYGELKEFCEIREQVLPDIAELEAWRRATIFRNDPPGWVSGQAPDSSTNAVASERPIP